MAITQEHLRRLALIRYMDGRAEEQAKAPEPLCSLAILTLHDALELFLALASEQLNVKERCNAFLDYWKVLDNYLTGGLPQRQAAERLNLARKDLKHHGILPSPNEVRGFVTAAVAFLEDSVPRVFQLEYRAVSLLDLVSLAEARQHLSTALEAVEKGNFERVAEAAVLAFEYVLEDYEARKTPGLSDSPFRPGVARFPAFARRIVEQRRIGSARGGPPFTVNTQELERRFSEISSSLASLSHAVRILTLGIDYRRYARFQLLTPEVSWGRSAEGVVFTFHYRHPGRPPTDEEGARFCVDFVIETAVALTAFDYSIEPGHRQPQGPPPASS